MTDAELATLTEGVLFALGRPLSRKELADMLGTTTEALEGALKHLASLTGRGVVVVDDGTELELRVAPEAARTVERIRKEEASREIGRAGLEVLAAILYRGPLPRADIDFIRGVNSTQTLRTLTMRGLIRRTPNPKDERSFLYEPTTELLSVLGATHTRDLPEFEEVRGKLEALEASYRGAQEQS